MCGAIVHQKGFSDFSETADIFLISVRQEVIPPVDRGRRTLLILTEIGGKKLKKNSFFLIIFLYLTVYCGILRSYIA